MKDAKDRTLLFLFKMSYLINFKEYLKIQIFIFFTHYHKKYIKIGENLDIFFDKNYIKISKNLDHRKSHNTIF